MLSCHHSLSHLAAQHAPYRRQFKLSIPFYLYHTHTCSSSSIRAPHTFSLRSHQIIAAFAPNSHLHKHNKMPKKWIPLESNPEVMTEFAGRIGLNTAQAAFHDIYGLDEEVCAGISCCTDRTACTEYACTCEHHISSSSSSNLSCLSAIWSVGCGCWLACDRSLAPKLPSLCCRAPPD